MATYGRDAKALLKELQSQNERMFLVTFLVLNTGRTEQELENNVFQASSIAQKHNCKDSVKIIRMSDVELTPVDWLWKPYLPFGKLSVLQGNPGEGKTYFAMHLAAACTLSLIHI